MVTFSGWGRAPPVLFAFWHWRCRLVSDAKAQWSGRGVLFSDPAGERLGKEVREPLEPKR